MTQPVLFLSHGAPPLADDPLWTEQLATWAKHLPRPEHILIVSAHWEQAPVTLSSTRAGTPLTYDFWGFPRRYYDVTYQTPAAPELADEVSGLLAEHSPVRRDHDRGLDHGAYVPLKEMFPDADIPTVQLSMPTLEPTRLFELGRRLAPLREAGVLIIGSGFTTHNLSWFSPAADAYAPAPAASREFDHWALEALAANDVDALLDFSRRAPAAKQAHPRTEHWAPIFLALGAAGTATAESTIDGFWYGLSKRSWQWN